MTRQGVENNIRLTEAASRLALARDLRVAGSSKIVISSDYHHPIQYHTVMDKSRANPTLSEHEAIYWKGKLVGSRTTRYRWRRDRQAGLKPRERRDLPEIKGELSIKIFAA